MKHKQITCNCPARTYPHRLDEKLCRALYNSGSDETYREFKAGMLRDFDRENAKSINLENKRINQEKQN